MSRPAAPGKLPAGLESLLAKYEIIDWLGEGGMGVLFLVRHRLLGERRVIKMIHPERAQEPEFRERFLHEARTAIRYRHPNIAQVFDFSADEGRAYLVMEYIDGITLQDLLKAHGPVEVDFAVAIGIQVLQALGFLHRKGVIHRDVSTDNIMLSRGEEGQALVKLIDLGLAKWMDSDVGLTAAQVFLGKIRYAPPEQFSLGTSELDPRGDLYSLGIVLYELVTGHFPILGNDASSIIAGHLFHPPRSFSETDPNQRVPLPLREVLLHALEKDRDHRVADSTRFQDHLRAAVPSWSDHGIEEGNLERLIARVRVATSARVRRGVPDEEKPDADVGVVVPVPLGATANVSGGTWLGLTSAAHLGGEANADPAPSSSSPSSGNGPADELLERPMMDPPWAEESALTSSGPVGMAARSAAGLSRWRAIGVVLAGLGALLVLGMLLFRLPRRPELSEEPAGREARVSGPTGEEVASAGTGPPAEAGQLPSSGSEPGIGDVVSPASAPAAVQATPVVPVVPARRISGGPPSYPEAARAKLASGVVRLDLEVLPTGRVGRVWVRGEADPDLSAAARNAVVDWRFEPATESGRPVASFYRVDLKFAPPEEGVATGAADSWVPPVRLFAVQPEYPDAARQQGVEGELAAELIVDAGGRVRAVKIQRGLSPELDRAAAEALRQWRFTPARRGGAAVESTYTVTIRFDLGR